MNSIAEMWEVRGKMMEKVVVHMSESGGGIMD